MQRERVWQALLEFKVFEPSWWFDESCACSHFGLVIPWLFLNCSKECVNRQLTWARGWCAWFLWLWRGRGVENWAAVTFVQ